MSGDRFRLYDAAQLEPVLDDMSRQLAALLDDAPTVLLGLLRRGAPLADLLVTRLRQLAPQAALVRLDLLVKRYADNLELLHPDTLLQARAEDAQALRGRRVIVVDDVLYQGYSLFRVFEWLRAQQAEQVHAAVLVDRRRQRLPVRADVVGVTLKIAPTDVIECNLPPYEAEFAVDLWRPFAGAGSS